MMPTASPTTSASSEGSDRSHYPEDPLLNHPIYSTVRCLGSGGQAFVLLAKNRLTKELVAIKCWPRGPVSISRCIRREVKNHSRFIHPHVVQYKTLFLTETYLCLVMEYVGGGTLLRFMNKHYNANKREVVARWFLQQLIAAVDYCHKKGIVSRDIKLENTLVVDGSFPLLKLTDFGFSKSASDSLTKTRVGSTSYIAPEVLVGNPYDGKAADVWSCGVMLYIMLFMKYPFDVPGQTPNEAMPQLMRKILAVDYVIPDDPPLSPGCRDLLERLLVGKPQDRLTIAQIAEHPWFKEGLPPDLFNFNDRCAQLDPNATPVNGTMHPKRIDAILDQAMTLPDLRNKALPRAAPTLATRSSGSSGGTNPSDGEPDPPAPRPGAGSFFSAGIPVARW